MCRFILESDEQNIPFKLVEKIRLKNTFSAFNKYLSEPNSNILNEIIDEISFFLSEDRILLPQNFIKLKMSQLVKLNILIQFDLLAIEEIDVRKFVFDEEYYLKSPDEIVRYIKAYLKLIDSAEVNCIFRGC